MKYKNKKEQKEKPIKCSNRLFIFVIVLILCFFIAISKLIEYQIIDYEKYETISKENSCIKEIIPAARGDIIDRNGVLLATNALNLNLVIGENFPFKKIGDDEEIIEKKNKEANAIILRLINILDREKIDWEENSPITKTKPYNFVKNKEHEIKKLKTELSQQQYATAQDCIELLSKKFNIDKSKYTEKQVRDIAVFRANMLIKGFSEYNKSFVVIDKVEAEFLDKITGKGNELKGIKILETSKRTYPCKEIGSHFIGNVGPLFKEDYDKYKEKGYSPDAIVGKFGIEKKFEDELKATNGVLVLEKDEEGNTTNKYYKKEPKPGNTVRLTIDYEFQKAIQEALPTFVKNHHSKVVSHAKGACVCVLDIKTGEVLALVSYPYYDINLYNSNYEEFKATKPNCLKNRAFEIYRPGSSFKIFIALTALMEHAISPSTIFNCRDGVVAKGGCAHFGHSRGKTNIYTAISASCNNYFYQVGNKLGIEKIDAYAPYFGYGVDTGLEIDNPDGRVTNPSEEFQKKYNTQYTIADLWQSSIGQSEVYATVLQQAICQLTLANRGTRLAAHIIKSIESPSKKIIKQTKPKILSKLRIPDFAYDTVLKGMRLQWSKKGRSKFDIASKSGSPQYSFNTKLTNGAGVGFYPSHNPEIAFAILIEDGLTAEDFFHEIVKIYEKIKTERKN